MKMCKQILEQSQSLTLDFTGFHPVGKIAEKAVCGSVFLPIWHCILSDELTQNALLQTPFWRFCPLGNNNKSAYLECKI